MKEKIKYLIIVFTFLFINLISAEKKCVIKEMTIKTKYDEYKSTTCYKDGIYCGELFNQCQKDTENYNNCLNNSKIKFYEIYNSIMNKTITFQDLMKNKELAKDFMQAQKNIVPIYKLPSEFSNIKEECSKYRKETNECTPKVQIYSGKDGILYTTNYNEIMEIINKNNFNCTQETKYIKGCYQKCIEGPDLNIIGVPIAETKQTKCCIECNGANYCGGSLGGGYN